ncbi:MAG: AAA family ATPase, partial [Rhodospirillaceae bacterium]
VLKLLAKDPEQRYQSAQGIVADLGACLDALTTGTVPEFPIGCHDVSPRFHIPEKLYGREAGTARLLAGFEQVANGATRLMLVSGPPGIGKSVLVQEVRKPLTARRGIFIQGKYDQFKRNIPYSGLVQAFRRLARHLLAEPEAALAAHRRLLLEAIAGNGAVVTALIPEFALILGDQPALPPLPPSESEFRFQLTFQNLVVALARPEQPLVLILDDLQWADRSSLALLSKLAGDPEIHHLMIIGTCRTEEGGSLHALGKMIETMTRGGIPVGTIEIGPLKESHVRALVADTTGRDDEGVTELTSLCYAKTEGNPFFLIQFLQALHEDGLIALNRATGRWTWDIAAIAGRNSTDNVVELMVAKLRRLDNATARALCLAACIGNSFDFATLSVAAEADTDRLAADLWPALEQGLVLPIGVNYHVLAPRTNGIAEQALEVETVRVRCRFLHDRVQQAAYSLIPEQERAAAHLRIGRLFLARGAEVEHLFEVADQLNQGRSQITDADERRRVTALDLEAARRAKASAAFEAAFAYARAGIELPGDDGWTDDYSSALALHIIAAEAATMLDDFAGMERHARAVLAAARNPVDAARVQMIRLTAAAGRGDPAEATRIGLEALDALGVALPHTSDSLREQLEVWRGRWALTRNRLGLSPPVADEDAAANQHRVTTARLLMAMVATAIISARHLLVPIAVRLLELALPSRDPGITSFGYLAWGLICSVTGDPAGAVRNSRRALDHLDTDILRSRYARVILIAYYCGQHWTLAPTPLRQRYLEVYHTALNAGDREYAAYGLAFRLRTAWQTGLGLIQLKEELAEATHLLTRLGTTPYTTYVAGLRQAIENLEAESDDPCRLDSAHFHEDTVLEALRTAGNTIVLTNLLSVKLALAVIFGNTDAARHILNEIAPHKHFLAGYSTEPVTRFLAALVDSAGPFSGRAARLVVATRLAGVIRWFRTPAAIGPANQRHRLLLLVAEVKRLRGRTNHAILAYEHAVAAAAEAGHLPEEALACERAAEFHRECGHSILERAYRGQARDAYSRWGARAKVRDIDRRFPESVPATLTAGAATSCHTVSTTTDRFTSGSFDFAAVLKVARAISGEIRLDALLETMLRTVLHSAGAERGLLLLAGAEHQLVLAAEADAGRDYFTLLPGLALESLAEDGHPRLPTAVITFAVRSGETVVLADAAEDSRFVEDPYIRARRPRSIMGLPLLRQGQLVGALYLENNLATDAFAGGRQEALRLLAAQMAISLENARLYADLSDFNRTLETQVADRTRELRTVLASEREAHEALRATQKQLVQAEKMASLAQLVAGMAHEINTPIGNAVTGISLLADMSESIHRSAKSGPMRRSEFITFLETLAETTEALLSNIRRAAGLVENFKMVAVDRTLDERRRFALQPYLKEILFSLRPTWQRAGHTVTLNCRNNLELDGYPGSIAQIVTNLVVNSVTHAYPEERTGTLSITVTVPDAKTIVLDYTDDGKGIAVTDRERVFDPFFTTRRSGGSTGLGLHIIYNLVTSKLGGRIELLDRDGPGTRFVVTLPKHAPEQTVRDISV